MWRMIVEYQQMPAQSAASVFYLTVTTRPLRAESISACTTCT